jgi:hypothetical protein
MPPEMPVAALAMPAGLLLIGDGGFETQSIAFLRKPGIE